MIFFIVPLNEKPPVPFPGTEGFLKTFWYLALLYALPSGCDHRFTAACNHSGPVARTDNNRAGARNGRYDFFVVHDVYITPLFIRCKVFSLFSLAAVKSSNGGSTPLMWSFSCIRGLKHGPHMATWQRTRQDEVSPHHMLFRATFDSSRHEHYSSAVRSSSLVFFRFC